MEVEKEQLNPPFLDRSDYCETVHGWQQHPFLIPSNITQQEFCWRNPKKSLFMGDIQDIRWKNWKISDGRTERYLIDGLRGRCPHGHNNFVAEEYILLFAEIYKDAKFRELTFFSLLADFLYFATNCGTLSESKKWMENEDDQPFIVERLGKRLWGWWCLK